MVGAYSLEIPKHQHIEIRKFDGWAVLFDLHAIKEGQERLLERGLVWWL